MALPMDEVLRALEESSSPEEVFSEGLQGNQEKVASTEETPASEDDQEKVASQEIETPETQETSTEEKPSEDDMSKVAEADAQGRIMARGFWDELSKLAVAPVAEYPADPGAIPNNAALEVGRGEPAQPHANKSAKVNAIIGQLVAANKVGAGEISTPAGVMPEQKSAPDEGNRPLAADVAKAQEQAATSVADVQKTGALDIVNIIYEKYFGGEK